VHLLDKYNKIYKTSVLYQDYYVAPEEFSCSEELDRTSDSPDPSTRIEEGIQNTSHFGGSEGPPAEGDNWDLVRVSQYQQDRETMPYCT
jgi:hypothetical protein